MRLFNQDFDWKKSINHINLLSQYISPKKLKTYDINYSKSRFNESHTDAIDRFMQEGMLVNCELFEIIYCVMTITELKKIAKNEGFMLGKTKNELVNNFLIFDRVKAEKIAFINRVLKCSELAKNFLDEYKKEELNQKIKSFESFLKYNSKEGYDIFLCYQRKYDPMFQADGFVLQKLNFILTSCPKAIGSITSLDLKYLRAAICMEELWRNESAIKWLGEKLSYSDKSIEIAINYLKCNSEIKRSLANQSDYFGKTKFKLFFDKNDTDSCSLCKGLTDQVFDINSLPELPLEKCTSKKGCQCRLYDISYEDEDDEEEENGLPHEDIPPYEDD